MPTHKPYTPTICNHKLRKMTLITEKNLSKVMGELNRFFKKPTKALQGYTKKKIRDDVVTMYGDTFTVPVFAEEETPNWVAFNGNCHLHWQWREYLEGKASSYLRPEEIARMPRLAISSPHEENCAPIYIGSRYKIFGNHLVIMEPYNKFIHSNPYCNTMWLRCREWVQTEVDPDEILKNQEYGLYCAITCASPYLSEELECSISDRDMIRIIENAVYNFGDEIHRRIPSILSRAGECVDEVFQLNDKDVHLRVDVDSWISGGNANADNWHLIIEGERTQNIIYVARIAFREEILRWQKQEEEDYSDDDNDYWGCDDPDFGDLDYD